MNLFKNTKTLISATLICCSLILIAAFQNFTPVNNIIENSLRPGSEISNSFENDQDLSKWYFFNNCSPGSSATKAFTAPEQRIDGIYTLRLQTNAFKTPCQWPGMYAESPSYEVHDGRTIRISAHIRNATYKGRSMLMFFDKNGKQLSATNSEWNSAQVWDWPNWHRQNILISTAPLGAESFKVRFDLVSPNAIIDIDSLQISGDKLKGFLFNPKAEYAPGKAIEIAWENNLLQNSEVKTSVTKELDLLVNNAHVNFLYIMVNTSTINLSYPDKTELNNVTSNLAEFVNMAWQRNIQVGIFLAHHCIVGEDYLDLVYKQKGGERPVHQAASPSHFSSCGKQNQNIDIASAWYSTVIKSVESKTKDLRGIAFWEFGGNPELGAAEMPTWDNSWYEVDRFNSTNTQKIYGANSFIKQVWPKFLSMSTRPKAFTLYPLIACGTSMLAPIVNFKKSIAGNLEPDYYILTSTMMTPLGNGSKNLDSEIYSKLHPENNIACAHTTYSGTYLDYISAKKVILGDFQWQQKDLSTGSVRELFNPSHLLPDAIAKYNFSLVRKHSLAGWWIWSYRDQQSDGSEGILDENDQWKEPQTSTIVNELRWPNE